MKKVLNKKETFEKFEKLSGRTLPIILDINEPTLQEAVRLALAEHFIDGYNKGKKKYKKFRVRYITLKRENTLLKEQIEKLKKDNASLQEKQFANYNRSKVIEALESQFDKKEK